MATRGARLDVAGRLADSGIVELMACILSRSPSASLRLASELRDGYVRLPGGNVLASSDGTHHVPVNFQTGEEWGRSKFRSF
jgi:hypothetical protein